MSLSHADFPAEEYQLRWQRARRYMQAHDLEALVVTSRENYRQIAGIRFRTMNRPYFLILPRERDAVLVTSRSLLTTLPHFTPVEQYVPYDQPFTTDAALEGLKVAGVTKGRVGYEGDVLIGSPVVPRLAGLTPQIAWVDASDYFWHVRAVKTPAEVERMQKASDVWANALAELQKRIKPGMTERQLYRELQHIIIDLRVEDYVVSLNVNAVGGSRVARAQALSDSTFNQGQHLWIDGSVCVGGYWCDFTRVFVWGQMPERHARKWEVIRAVTDRAIASLKPGISLAQLHALGFETCQEMDANPDEICGVGDISRVHLGHGVSLTRNEVPEIGPWNPHIIAEPGMTLTIEPGYINAEGIVHTEEMVVVTENGCRVLSNQLPPLLVLD